MPGNEIGDMDLWVGVRGSSHGMGLVEDWEGVGMNWWRDWERLDDVRSLR